MVQARDKASCLLSSELRPRLAFLAGTLVYELITGKQLFEVGNNLASYEAKLASFHLMDFSNCPPQLVSTLKAMLSRQPSARPNANAFAGAPYFQVSSLPSAITPYRGIGGACDTYQKIHSLIHQLMSARNKRSLEVTALSLCKTRRKMLWSEP